jgi:NitT/TauT family transport system substrate-binding protein
LTAVVAAARSGQVDGFVTSLPLTAQAAAEGWGQTWVSWAGGDVPGFTDLITADLAASTKYMEEHPEVIAAFSRVLWRATTMFREEPEQARAALREWFPDMDESLYNLAFDTLTPLFESDPVPTPEGFEFVLSKYNVAADQPIEDLEFEEAYDTSFILAAAP